MSVCIQMLIFLNRSVKQDHVGACHDKNNPLCLCPHIYMPVCGKDGLTYDNHCLMECA